MARIDVDSEDYQRLVRRLRELPPEIRRDMRKGLRNAGKIGAMEARRSARAMQATGHISQVGRNLGQRHHGVQHVRGRSRGLRSVLAANIRVQVGADDVRIIQGTQGIGGQNARGLPRRLDGDHRWTHPVFGHGQALQSNRPYFKRSIAAKRDEMTREVATVLRTIERRLT